MTTRLKPANEVVAKAVALATEAPSIHNTQPWQWRLTSSALELYADQTRRLASADPHGRSLLISCGAGLHHLCVAMAASGWNPIVLRMPDVRVPSLLASVSFEPRDPTDDDIAWASAISRRHSDRRSMSSWPVSYEHVERLRDLAPELGGILQLLDEFQTAFWESLAQRIIDRRAQDARHQSELQRWVSVEGSAEGIPASNLLESGIQAWGSEDPERFPPGTLRRAAVEGEPPFSLALLLSTSSDDPLSRLRAGEALSAILLEAARVGLSTRMDSQVVEVETTRAQLEQQLLRGTRSPQILIRVGWPAGGEPVPPTPRRRLKDVLKVSESQSMAERLSGASSRGDAPLPPEEATDLS